MTRLSSRVLVVASRAVARANPSQNAAVGRRCYSDNTTTSKTGSSPQDILKMGFEKLQSTKDKSQVDKSQLLGAAQKLGISDQVEQIFNNVDPSSKSYLEMNQVEREVIDKQDIETFSVPPITQAHRPFEYDDLPSKGHIQLREHRIQREYNRIAAYDLPQLASLAKPYRPLPDSEGVLLFKYNTFLGEDHPAAAKVSVQIGVAKLSAAARLTELQQHKLKLLAGPRYNPSSDTIVISCQKFALQAQNKRSLADTIKKLLAEARNTESDAEYADLPLDTRHMAARARRKKSLYPLHAIPQEWMRPQDAPKPKQDLFSVIERGFLHK